MLVKLLTLRYLPSLGVLDDRALVAFLADKNVVTVREHFFTVDDVVHLAVLLTYRLSADSATGRPAPHERDTRSRTRTAPPQDLKPADRPRFETLREWRATRARKDGVPPYIILTNRELAAIVAARPATPSVAGTGRRAGETTQRAPGVVGRRPAPATEPPGAPRLPWRGL